MAYFLGILFMIVGLLISVALHELGHLIPARLFGADVPRYMIGFGPTLYSRKIGKTEFGIKAILLGGYVQIAGMFYPGRPGTVIGTRNGQDVTVADYRLFTPAEREEVELSATGDARARTIEEEAAGAKPYYGLKRWQRATVMFGGPAMNALLALVIIAVAALGIGIPQPSTTLAVVPVCADGSDSCAQTEQLPAAKAGFEAGDQITAINNQKTNRWSDVTSAIETAGAKSLTVTVLRDGSEQTLQVTPLVGADGRARIGIISHMQRQAVPVSAVWDIWWGTTRATAKMILTLPQNVWHTTKAIFGQEQRSNEGVISIVGAGRAAGEVAAGTTEMAGEQSILDRILTLAFLLASLNIALFVFNLIPLTPLDGGHIIAIIYEAIRSRLTRNKAPADTARMLPVTYTVFGLLALMTVILIVADFLVPVRI